MWYYKFPMLGKLRNCKVYPDSSLHKIALHLIVHARPWISGFYPNDPGFHFWWWSKIILSYLKSNKQTIIFILILIIYTEILTRTLRS